MKVSINLVTYNAIKYIDDCLKSILNQSFKDFKTLVVDNASDDGTVEHIRKNYPEVTVLQNFKNLGFAKANNQGIKFWDSEYVLLINQDVILQPDFLDKLVKSADKHPEGGSFGGKTLKLSALEENQKILEPDVIDTTGIAATKARRFYDRGAGEKDKGQYDKTEEVFGISGNLVLYRRKALTETKIKSLEGREGFKFAIDFDYFEYFDENFFMYKEDVDLAWRLRWAGWKAFYLPTAEACHYRSGFGHATANLSIIIKDRRRKSKLINKLSYKNHWLSLIKNESGSNFFLHLPWIFLYELKKIIYVLILEIGTLGSIGQCLKLLPSTLRKRKQVMKMRKIENREMRRWFK